MLNAHAFTDANQLACDSLRNAVISLYNDQIKPTSVDVGRRLLEDNAPAAVIQHFISFAKQFPNVFRVHSVCSDNNKRTNGGVDDHVIELVDMPLSGASFVDPKATEDPYMFSVWMELGTFLCVLQQTDNNNNNDNPVLYQFRGGRYGMACMLHSVAAQSATTGDERAFGGLPLLMSLSGASLGRVCHLVQLAISKGMLAYENNVLQPAVTCRGRTSCAFACEVLSLLASDVEVVEVDDELLPVRAKFPRKYTHTHTHTHHSRPFLSGDDTYGDIHTHTHAYTHTHINPYTNPALACLTVEDVVECLIDVFKLSPRGLLLSQLKKRIMSLKGVTLTSSLFGYSKLSSLLTSPYFTRICTLALDNNHHLFISPRHTHIHTHTHTHS
eukprot:GHVR01129691.1.p1 GENE.GHVR01129691.1~~GHVR01129691.1.p1  ORF type:complete len:385 (+),score=135.09 GHVR01129691.1:96-1250(+)